MRLLNRNTFHLHTWNVSDYIKQAQNNIIKQDSNHYITLQNIFKKLYLAHLKNHSKINAHSQKLNSLAVMSESPARIIAEYFHRKAKTYNEDFMRTTFQHLGKAYRVSKNDTDGTLDTLGYQLFLSSEFTNLTE